MKFLMKFLFILKFNGKWKMIVSNINNKDPFYCYDRFFLIKTNFKLFSL